MRALDAAFPQIHARICIWPLMKAVEGQAKIKVARSAGDAEATADESVRASDLQDEMASNWCDEVFDDIERFMRLFRSASRAEMNAKFEKLQAKIVNDRDIQTRLMTTCLDQHWWPYRPKSGQTQGRQHPAFWPPSHVSF